ncbi:MAG: hypothetical protein HQM14_10925 [SAR324 cluster bacterium]|nr:hypothetical protein [SAR324 cluster bacterium]
MKQQGSLVTTLLVILESIAVVGFLFLIFAVSSSSNIGKYEYQLSVKSKQGNLKPLKEAVVWATDQGKQLSFHTDEEGIARFRTKHSLDAVTVSATNHFTQTFSLEKMSGEKKNHKQVFILEAAGQETSNALGQTVKLISVIDEQNHPITNALVTLTSETPAQSFQYDPLEEAYPLIVRGSNQQNLFSVSAPGYVPQFDVNYDASASVIKLTKQPNLNFPYQFQISVFDAGENAHYSSLEETGVASDAPKAISKKALDDVDLSIDQGAVIKNALGSFQVFSRKDQNELKINAPQYFPQNVVLVNKEKNGNHYQVFLKKNADIFKYTLNIKTLDEQNNPVTAGLETETNVAVQKEKSGIYRLYTNESELKLTVKATGYKAQQLTLFPEKQTNYQITLQSQQNQTFSIQVSDRKEQPIIGAVVTILGDNSKTTRTDEKGIALLEAFADSKKALLAAPGYITQTVELPEPKQQQRILQASYQLKTNPMSTYTHKVQVKVLNEAGKPMSANVSSSEGFVSKQKKGLYQVLSPTANLQLSVAAPGYDHKTIFLSDKKPRTEVKVSMKKAEKGVVLNTDVGDRLILSKGVVYRVIQPIDKKTVKVYRRTDPTKGEFNDYPKGRIVSIDQFNREVELEKSRKNFYDENVWVTVYALDKKEYFLFKNVYRKLWSDYKMVYANHR